MSAILPNGTRKIAAASTAEVATQLNDNASIENSLPMAGSAMLTEEAISGVKKAAAVDAANAARLSSRAIIADPVPLLGGDTVFSCAYFQWKRGQEPF